MPNEKSPGKPTTRRYSEAEKDQAVRLVRKLRPELAPITARCSVSRPSWVAGWSRCAVAPRP